MGDTQSCVNNKSDSNSNGSTNGSSDGSGSVPQSPEEKTMKNLERPQIQVFSDDKNKNKLEWLIFPNATVNPFPKKQEQNKRGRADQTLFGRALDLDQNECIRVCANEPNCSHGFYVDDKKTGKRCYLLDNNKVPGFRGCDVTKKECANPLDDVVHKSSIPKLKNMSTSFFTTIPLYDMANVVRTNTDIQIASGELFISNFGAEPDLPVTLSTSATPSIQFFNEFTESRSPLFSGIPLTIGVTSDDKLQTALILEVAKPSIRWNTLNINAATTQLFTILQLKERKDDSGSFYPIPDKKPVLFDTPFVIMSTRGLLRTDKNGDVIGLKAEANKSFDKNLKNLIIYPYNIFTVKRSGEGYYCLGYGSFANCKKIALNDENVKVNPKNPTSLKFKDRSIFTEPGCFGVCDWQKPRNTLPEWGSSYKDDEKLKQAMRKKDDKKRKKGTVAIVDFCLEPEPAKENFTNIFLTAKRARIIFIVSVVTALITLSLLVYFICS